MSAATNRLAPSLLQYVGATVLSMLGLGAAFLFRNLRGVPDGLVFAATIALIARFYGLGPSLFASALSIIAIDLDDPPADRSRRAHAPRGAHLFRSVRRALARDQRHDALAARGASGGRIHVDELEQVNRQVAATGGRDARHLGAPRARERRVDARTRRADASRARQPAACGHHGAVGSTIARGRRACRRRPGIRRPRGGRRARRGGRGKRPPRARPSPCAARDRRSITSADAGRRTPLATAIRERAAGLARVAGALSRALPARGRSLSAGGVGERRAGTAARLR